MDRVSDRLKGIGKASLFLSLFGGLWMVAALDAQSFVWLACCALLPTSLLVLRSAGVIHAGNQVRETEPEATAEEHAAARDQGRRFGWVFLTEFGAIAIAANLLAAYGHPGWILPAIGMIVGAHFLPLAKIFNYPLYAWTGGAEIVLCALIAWAMRGRLDAADSLLGLAMGLSLWTTVLIGLVQARWLERAVGGG